MVLAFVPSEGCAQINLPGARALFGRNFLYRTDWRVTRRELGVEDVYAELRPEDKAMKVRELAERYGHVAMVGDGVNGAPALAEATVGVVLVVG
jgi:magnesium-transporting ATPase (P-type)